MKIGKTGMVFKRTSIAVVALIVPLVFFLRWSITDNLFFILTKPARFREAETYVNQELGFSVDYPARLSPYIQEEDNSASFGDPPLFRVYVTEKEDNQSLWEYVLKSETRGDRSLRWFAQWNPLLHPLLGSKGYSLNFLNRKPVLCISHPKVAGSSGRGFTVYYANKEHIYMITTMYFYEFLKNYVEFNKILAGFKVL